MQIEANNRNNVSARVDRSVRTPESTAPVWLRFGLPIGLATLAATMNYSAVRNQLQPTPVYALTTDLPPGTRLKASHLKLINLAGEFDRQTVFAADELLIIDEESGIAASLAASLDRQPRVLGRPGRRGEILLKSSFGGTEMPRKGERTIAVPRDIVQANDEFLSPGKIVYFHVVQRDASKADGEVPLIGPFRVVVEDIDLEAQKGRRERPVVHVAYGVTPDGQTSSSASLLLKILGQPGSCSLIAQEMERPNIPHPSLNSDSQSSPREDAAKEAATHLSSNGKSEVSR